MYLCVCVRAFVVCLSKLSSCGCCLMQEQVRRMELHFNEFYEEIKKEMIKTMTNLDVMRGGSSGRSAMCPDKLN